MSIDVESLNKPEFYGWLEPRVSICKCRLVFFVFPTSGALTYTKMSLFLSDTVRKTLYLDQLHVSIKETSFFLLYQSFMSRRLSS